MKLWRIARPQHAGDAAGMLNGLGAARYGGRWNPRGRRAVYCAESSSLAMLEILVHHRLPGALPEHRILDLEVPDDEILDFGGAVPKVDDVVAALDERLAVAVRSMVNPFERNVVIDPLHPGFDRIRPGTVRPFRFDPRLRPN